MDNPLFPMKHLAGPQPGARFSVETSIDSYKVDSGCTEVPKHPPFFAFIPSHSIDTRKSGRTRDVNMPTLIEREGAAMSGPIGSRLRNFCKSTSGSFTIESVIWIPMFFILVSFAMNVSMVFFNEAQILRVVQSVSRQHSLGLYRSDVEARADLSARLAYLNANIGVDASKTFNLATASVQVTASDMMPMPFLRVPFEGLTLQIASNHAVEY